LIDQLHENTSDGLADENASDNCVPASLSEGLHILTGRAFNGDELKDAVYGQGWTGFQSASRYVAYCADDGVSLAAHNDTQAGLVATIHREVSAGHPVIVTMPSQWGTAPADPVHPSGYTHVGIAVGVGPGMIRVMNPWHGFFQDQADSWWQARLCEGQVWVMQKAGASMTTSVPSGWTDNGTVLTAPNGLTVGTGFRAWILAHPWDAANQPESRELSVSDVETSDPKQGAGTVQYFRFTQLSWTKARGVWESWVGLEAYTMRQQLATAETQAQHDAAIIGAQAGQIATLTTQVAQLQTQVKSLEAQLAAAIHQGAAPTTPAEAITLFTQLLWAEAEATLKAASLTPPSPTTPMTAG